MPGKKTLKAENLEIVVRYVFQGGCGKNAYRRNSA